MPMKELFLIRHGKSSWDHPNLSDHDRPLNHRGERDAPRMARAFVKRRIEPDQVVTRTAIRAKNTAFRMAATMEIPGQCIREENDLYLASPHTILRIVQSLDESLETVFLFGHNPGMHEAVVRFSGSSAVPEFPTPAVGRIQFEQSYWGEIDWGSGNLAELILPREL